MAHFKEILMPDTALRASEAARRLQMPTNELLRLVQTKQIWYIIIDGIAHVPEDAVEEYGSRIKSWGTWRDGYRGTMTFEKWPIARHTRWDSGR